MTSHENSASSPRPSPPTRPSASSTSEMLTSSEVQQLRQEMREASDYFDRVLPEMLEAKLGRKLPKRLDADE